MSRSFVRTTLASLSLVLVFAAGCGDTGRKESIQRANAGHKALGAKQFDTAITEYKEAVRAYRDNHAAYYFMGEAYRLKKDFDKATEAYAEAVRIKPDNVMYQMMYGVALYEDGVAKAREDAARVQNKKPAEVEVDYSMINFDQAEQHLLAAVKLNADLYFEHMYLGRIYRATSRPREAAESFSKAIVSNPREWAPYVALSELYRKWDYPNEAIQVLTQGVEHVPGQVEKAALHYQLGMAYTEKQDDAKAIEAFTAAVEASKDLHVAKFMRGQAYFRKGDFKAADKDLEAYAKAAGPADATNKSIAQKMRFSIAAKLQGG
ncbi:MAG: tetratricopeptide repeat protein [Myxococcales bacterium]|nr:tetratricopeptide repeat protein [Myxococcales bacterium]